MSSSTQHSLDHRSALLASKIRHRIEVLKVMMRPATEIMPGTVQHTSADALAWWRKHRYDEIGGRVLAGRTPAETMQLDAWLARNPDPSLEPPLL